MRVLCSIPVQIPVHRIRVTASCLATGGPVHTATLRLMDYWGESPEEIAEVLGLPIPYVQKVIGDLGRGGEPIERDFVLWVDNARGRVLPFTALADVAVQPNRGAGHRFPIEAPVSENELAGMGLQSGLSWDMGLEGHVEILEITEVVTDVRNPSLPHVLRLPDTQLVIRRDRTGVESFQFEVTQHGLPDSQLTAWVRTSYADDLASLVANGDLHGGHTPPPRLSQMTAQGGWQSLEPHPRELREQIAEAAEATQERFVLCAPDLRFIPAWLRQILEGVAERDVDVVLCPANPDHVLRARHLDFTAVRPTNPLPALAVIADEDLAVVHSDPAACLDGNAKPSHQSLYATGQASAIGWLLERIGLRRLRRRPPAARLTPQAIASMLRQALEKLRHELPTTIRAEIQDADVQFAIETLSRHPGREKPTQAARRAAAGIAWERVLIERVARLAAQHDQLAIAEQRWKPPEAKLDLDMIVHDRQKNVVWILDAKNAKLDDDQLAKMRDQIALLKRHPEITAGVPIRGAIVHHRNQLAETPQATEHHNIVRCTLQGVADLLLAKRLPGEQPQPIARGRAA